MNSHVPKLMLVLQHFLTNSLKLLRLRELKSNVPLRLYKDCRTQRLKHCARNIGALNSRALIFPHSNRNIVVQWKCTHTRLACLQRLNCCLVAVWLDSGKYNSFLVKMTHQIAYRGDNGLFLASWHSYGNPETLSTAKNCKVKVKKDF